MVSLTQQQGGEVSCEAEGTLVEQGLQPVAEVPGKLLGSGVRNEEEAVSCSLGGCLDRVLFAARIGQKSVNGLEPNLPCTDS